MNDAKDSLNFLQFDGTEVVAEVIIKMPEATEILLAHGLSCASCHLNVHEPLKEGILSHGYQEKDFKAILKDLNDAAETLKIPREGRTAKDPELTEYAANKVREFQAESSQSGWGFKIEVLEDTVGSAQYYLDFFEKPDKGDRIIETRGIQLFLDRDSAIFLKNCQIDYLEDSEKGEGFKIEKIKP